MNPLGVVIQRFLSRLERPQLFKIAATLFLITLVIPDPIPLADEILLGIVTLLAAKKKSGPPDVIDVQP